MQRNAIVKRIKNNPVKTNSLDFLHRCQNVRIKEIERIETDLSPKPEQLGNDGNEEQDRVSKNSRKTGGVEAHFGNQHS